MGKIKMEVPFFQVPNGIFDLGLTSNEIVVYMYLARCGNNSKAFPSYKTIGEKTGTSRPTAMRIVKKLEEIGLIYKEIRKFVKETDDKQKVFNKSNIYVVQHDLSKLNIPSITEIPPLVSDRHYPSITEIPYKELYIKNYSNKELSSINESFNNDLGVRYNSKEEFLNNFLDLDNEYSIANIIYDKFRLKLNFEHYKLDKKQIEKVLEGLQFIDESTEYWDEIDTLLDYYFSLNNKYYSIQHFTNLNTLAFILSKTGIHEEQRFNIEGFEGVI